jgi:hypothetical protein
MPAVPEGVSERMSRRTCLPQVQVDGRMALSLDRSAEHLELAEHLIVLTLAARGRDWHGAASWVRTAFPPLADSTTQPFSTPEGRHTNGGRASMNSDRHKSNRLGRHETRLSADAGQNRRQDSGDWKQKRDRYLALAHAAASAGDAVEAENYYQHADHYFRLMQQGA